MKTTILLLTVFAFAMMNATAQNTGINTSTPQAYLDINGDLAMRMGVINLPNTANADVNTTTSRKSVYRITNSSPLGASISGLTGGVDGRTITLINTSTSQISLENSIPTSSSTAANQILTNDGNSLYLPTNGAVTLIYDANGSRWRVSSFGKPLPVVPDPLWYRDDSSNVYNLNNGKVGIGNTNPSEKLDVNGNVNINGTIKANGAAGAAGQVLTSNGATMAWGNIGIEYKYMATFDCSNTTNTPGTDNCNANWTVPTGVTSILVEGWGGGGGGGNLGSGGGGAYISTRFTVASGDAIAMIIGAGGYNGTYFSNGISTNGIKAGNTKITVGGVSITAGGGEGGLEKVDGTNNSGNPRIRSGFIATQESVGYYGSAGKASVINYVQVSSGAFVQQVYYADGGDAALSPGSGGQGGYSINIGTFKDTYGTAGQQPGGGGGADYFGGQPGMGGRVVIHY